ncbi:MAG: triose-phosphate isomerase, partial [Lactobacillus iners]|nr:triose-phosphate isomerase [Lactobacillus iners]
SLETREANKQEEWVVSQIKAALEGLTAEQVSSLVIAYEPIWAIGTGKTASSDQAEEMCKTIRETVKDLYDEATSDNIRIQYGGSVKPANVKELMAKPNIDGGLVGGASLDPESFLALVNYQD